MVAIDSHLDGVSPESLGRFVLRARREARLRGQIHVLITSNRRMRALNRQFRGQDRATDVLSFSALPEVARDFAGDIAISREIAAANARRLGHPLAYELKVLILHGVLHLAGYDHESDNGEMARREQRLRRKLGLGDGLIERASNSDGRAPLSGVARAGTRKRRAER